MWTARCTVVVGARSAGILTAPDRLRGCLVDGGRLSPKNNKKNRLRRSVFRFQKIRRAKAGHIEIYSRYFSSNQRLSQHSHTQRCDGPQTNVHLPICIKTLTLVLRICPVGVGGKECDSLQLLIENRVLFNSEPLARAGSNPTPTMCRASPTLSPLLAAGNGHKSARSIALPNRAFCRI